MQSASRDVLVIIFSYLSHHDLLALMPLCKKLYRSVKHFVSLHAKLSHERTLQAIEKCEFLFLKDLKPTYFKPVCKAGLTMLIHRFSYDDYVSENWNWELIAACEYGNKDVAKLMIERGANELNDALYVACLCHHEDVAQLMIECGATYCDHCRTDHKN